MEKVSMKKASLFSILVMLSLFMSACSAAASSTPTRTGNGNTGGPNGDLPLGIELAIGTLALEKTPTPIDSKQANDLLFLWKGLAQMLKAQNSAKEEVQGLLKQIQGTMTADQMKAIQAMHLNYQQVGQIARQYGLQIGIPGGTNHSAQQNSSTPQASRQRNTGGFQGGGGIPGFGGGGRNPSNNSQAVTYNAFQNTGLTQTIIDAVIKYLDSIVKQ
jgi:hypothetical protein